MKRYKTINLKKSAYWLTAVSLVLIWLIGMLGLSSCKKDGRLFTHVDSIGAVPSQFHFFNTFSYDTTLTLSVDGLPRQRVKSNAFSEYYSSSSGFNLNAQQPNSKLLNTYDPIINSLYNALGTMQFQPNTSYLVFSKYTAYDTITAPKRTIVPTLVYYPEDVYHPFDGTTAVRFFNLVAGQSAAKLTITPNMGAGTSLSPAAIALGAAQPARASDSYSTTQGGMKNISINFTAVGYSTTGTLNVLFTFQQVAFDNSKAYSIIATGDIKNYLAKLEPRPKVFLVEDGNPANTRELTLSSITFPGNLTTTAAVRVMDGAYNIPGIITSGAYGQPGFVQMYGTTVTFNQTSVLVYRWPVKYVDNVGWIETPYDPLVPPTATSLLARTATTNLTPGSYRVNTKQQFTQSPLYNSFDQNFEQGLSYTVCLLPDNNSTGQCGTLVLQNDQQPDPNLFKLRVINMMGGVPQVDVHLNSASGPVIASSVTFGQASDYIPLQQNLVAQNLYITAAGSTTPLFQTGTKNGPLQLPFRGGNSGTMYLMGLNTGVAYTGAPGIVPPNNSPMPPYVYFVTDAFINSTSNNGNLTLFF